MKLTRKLTLLAILCTGAYILYQYITATAEVERAINTYRLLQRYGTWLGLGLLALFVLIFVKSKKSGKRAEHAPRHGKKQSPAR